LTAQNDLRKVGMLDVCSIGNMSTVIFDNFLDLFTVTESWHHYAESPSIVAATLTGYYVVKRA